MKTDLKKEKELRGIPKEYEVSIEQIAIKSSLLPLLIEDSKNIVKDVIFCESISGGKDTFNNMPKSLNLTRLTEEHNELNRFTSDYISMEYLRELLKDNVEILNKINKK